MNPRLSLRASAACTSAAPPPITIPSSTAARVAEIASSRRCFFSFNSTSVCAPTLMTQTPPASLATRSCNFSRSQSESEVASSLRISATRAATSALSPAPSTMVVASLVITMRRARPRSARVAASSFIPISPEITVAPVKIAMSCNIALRRSPKPGALTAADVNTPRMRFTTSVESASPSTSSAMIKSGFPACETFSSRGRSSGRAEILFAEIRTYASSRTDSIRSWSVTKYGEM